jgi:5-methylcytosine-specific restriction protein A
MMRIRDLPRPVTASKADWLPANQWAGFTPTGKGPDAHAKCEATIVRQMAKGYILERVTSNFGEPNSEFSDDPRIAQERIEHAKVADSLVAVHHLRHAALPLREIVGDEDFEWLQNAWAEPSKRNRWSVAFPIVRSFRIVGAPKSKDVLSREVFRRIYQSQNALLRLLDDEARAEIADLEIEEVEVPAVLVGLDQDYIKAIQSDVTLKNMRDIGTDLRGAIEGETEERRSKIVRRAAWLADKFIRERIKLGDLKCDKCSFDPKHRDDLSGIKLRSCFDVHHTNPLAEGRRFTDLDDLALLCPTCHRIEHLQLALARPAGSSLK